MRSQIRLCMVVIAGLVTVSAYVRAEPRTYALVVGNNAPPSEEAGSSAPLRYADDDAVRFHRFFKYIGAETRLFTVLDKETQSRFKDVPDQAEVPTFAAVRQAAEKLGKQIEKDRREGKKTVVYVVFSGHGKYTESGEPSLVLLDGLLTQSSLYQDIVAKLDADFQHLFIDACYAEGIVGTRGLFNREVDGQRTAITDADRRSIAVPAASQFPGLGVAVSSSADKESHEWSKLESGVFTHELLSGLMGPADVNRDGKIVYSEIYAFISAANRNVTDERGKIDVITRPPDKNQNAPIVDLASFKNSAFLFGDPSKLRHFAVELQNGERYLDANLGSMTYSHIALPTSGIAYLRTREMEAKLDLKQGALLNFGDLKFEKYETQAKGSIETALSKGLFASPYGVDYYQGFVDKSGLTAVSFDAAPFTLENQPTIQKEQTSQTRKAFAISSFALSGAAGVAAVVCGALSLSAKSDFESTDLQRDAYEANQRYVHLGNATWISAAFVPIGIAAGFLLRPHQLRRANKHKAESGILHSSDSLLLKVTF